LKRAVEWECRNVETGGAEKRRGNCTFRATRSGNDNIKKDFNHQDGRLMGGIRKHKRPKKEREHLHEMVSPMGRLHLP